MMRLLLVLVGLTWVAAQQSCQNDDGCDPSLHCGCRGINAAASSLERVCLPRRGRGETCGGYTPCPGVCSRGLICQDQPRQAWMPAMADLPGLCCQPLDCVCPTGFQPIHDTLGCATCACERIPCGDGGNVAISTTTFAPIACNAATACTSGICDMTHNMCCVNPFVDESFDATTFEPSSMEGEAVAYSTSPDEDMEIDETALVPEASETSAPSEIPPTPQIDEEEEIAVESTSAGSAGPEIDGQETTPLPMDGSEPPSTSTDLEATSEEPLLGSLKRVDPSTDAVRGALTCAVLELNRLSNSLSQLQLVRVTDVYAQVVAGTLYEALVAVAESSVCRNDGVLRTLEECPVDGAAQQVALRVLVQPWLGDSCNLISFALLASSTRMPGASTTPFPSDFPELDVEATEEVAWNDGRVQEAALLAKRFLDEQGRAVGLAASIESVTEAELTTIGGGLEVVSTRIHVAWLLTCMPASGPAPAASQAGTGAMAVDGTRGCIPLSRAPGVSADYMLTLVLINGVPGEMELDLLAGQDALTAAAILVAGGSSTSTPLDEGASKQDDSRLWLAQPAVWVPLAVVMALLVGAMLVRPRHQVGGYDVKAAFHNPGFAVASKSEPSTPPAYV